VARSRAKNFYYSFVLLSAQQRKAMCAIYAFMRYCDDLSDEPSASRAAVDQWRADMEAAFEGHFADHPVWPAFHHTVRRFGIPHDYFRQMIAGISSDLEPRSLETFDELYRYCYQVASVVGLTIIHIFGFRYTQRSTAGREMRRGVSVDQYPARTSARMPNAGASICRPKTCAASASPRRSARWQPQSGVSSS